MNHSQSLLSNIQQSSEPQTREQKAKRMSKSDGKHAQNKSGRDDREKRGLRSKEGTGYWMFLQQGGSHEEKTHCVRETERGGGKKRLKE